MCLGTSTTQGAGNPAASSPSYLIRPSCPGLVIFLLLKPTYPELFARLHPFISLVPNNNNAVRLSFPPLRPIRFAAYHHRNEHPSSSYVHTYTYISPRCLVNDPPPDLPRLPPVHPFPLALLRRHTSKLVLRPHMPRFKPLLRLRPQPRRAQVSSDRWPAPQRRFRFSSLLPFHPILPHLTHTTKLTPSPAA